MFVIETIEPGQSAFVTPDVSAIISKTNSIRKRLAIVNRLQMEFMANHKFAEVLRMAPVTPRQIFGQPLPSGVTEHH